MVKLLEQNSRGMNLSVCRVGLKERLGNNDSFPTRILMTGEEDREASGE